MKTHFAFILLATLTLVGCHDNSTGAEASATSATSGPAKSAGAANPQEDATSLIRTIGKDELPSETGVGSVVNGKISSTGKAGYLLYGPYAALKAGTYQITVDGTIESLPSHSKVVIDAVSGQGSNTLGSIEISSAPNSGATLANFTAIVPQGTTDLEIRVHVPENGHLSVNGYQVQPKQ